MSTNLNKVSIKDTEQHVLHSQIVGDKFEINVALPKKYEESTKNYPVAYLLDSNIFFGLFVDTARLLHFGQEIPELVIVGIGYPNDNDHLQLRNRDYLPTSNDLDKISGCAERFLAFLLEELIPYITERYRVSLEDTLLAGDSFSGLFGLYTLFNKPEAFKRYIIGSPSIYWDDTVIFNYEDTYASNHKNLSAIVFMSVGALEAIYEPEFAAMVSNVKKLSKVLTERKYPDLKLFTHVFYNETHLSVIPATMSRGLRVVFNQKQ